jgi:F-type H+-transporting ATPase subunit delta
MLIRKTAVNYAKALFAVPGTQEKIQKRQADLEHLVDVIRDQPPVLQLLCYPELSIEERLKKVEELLKMEFDPILRKFLGVLLKKGKANHLIAVASEYRKLVVNDLKSLDVGLQSLEPLSENTRKKLLSKLENNFKKKINLIETINPKLLSGFVLQIGNKLLDLSIKGKLTKLKRLILKGEA